MKKCTMCGETKSLEDFSKNKRNKKDGRQPKCKECNKAYYLANKEKIKKRVNDHYHNEHEKHLKRRAELRKRPEAKRKKAEQDASYYRRNKEKIQEYFKEWAKENREHLRCYFKWWYHNNREIQIFQNGNNTLTKEEIRELFLNHPYCEYCGDKENLTLDHIIPFSRGGQNCIENVTITCKPCNSSKNGRLLSEWPGRVIV